MGARPGRRRRVRPHRVLPGRCRCSAFWDRSKLADDGGVIDGGGWGGVTLAYAVGSPAEVDAVLAEAEAAGARITRAAVATFCGGYFGVFVDPDGYPWEAMRNPAWELHADGTVSLG